MAESWLGFHRVYRLVEVTIDISNLEPLRIGSGRGLKPESVSDLPIIRMRVGDVKTPYIPGSSFKGVLRSISEYISRNYGLPNICERGE